MHTYALISVKEDGLRLERISYYLPKVSTIQDPKYPIFAGPIGVELDSGTFTTHFLLHYNYISESRQSLHRSHYTKPSFYLQLRTKPPFHPARDRLRKTLHPVAEFNVKDIFSTKGLSSSGTIRSNTCNIRMRKNIASASANSSVKQKNHQPLSKAAQRRGKKNETSLTPDT